MQYCLLLLALAAPAAAQDLGGIVDLGQHSAVQAHAATMNNAAKARSPRSRHDVEMTRLCRKLRGKGEPLPSIRARYQQAMAMCRQGGY